jgi:hypothetical protein
MPTESVIDTDQPYVAYTMISADSCERTDIYQLQAGKLVCEAGQWEPHDPNDHTDFVSVECGDVFSGELHGDDHRDLESEGKLDGFIRLVLGGKDVDAALQSALSSSPPTMTPR